MHSTAYILMPMIQTCFNSELRLVASDLMDQNSIEQNMPSAVPIFTQIHNSNGQNAMWP